MTIVHELAAAIADPDYDWSSSSFDTWSRRVFAHQFEHNAPYQRFCQGRGVTPDSLKHWRDIPAVPTDVFKHVDLTTGGEPERVFRTSGTTTDRRGQHLFPSLEAYRAAIPGPFARWCMAGARRLPMAILAPSPGELVDSSLSFMLGELVGQFGHPMWSGFFIGRDDEDELDFDIDALVDWLESARHPVFLLGTAFAFVEFFDATDGLTFSLPAGSRVLETGGLKGRTREVTRQELYGLFETRLGIPETHALSEYSMTELSSQAYSNNLADNLSWRDASFQVPPWVRIEVVDPATLEVLGEPGATGLIRWYDLANIGSVMVVQTSDLGFKEMEGGFRLMGRAQGAELRGCSLTIEEILTSR